jgi:hypothetical protein
VCENVSRLLHHLGLKVLWHAVFMNLLTGFDQLERALERDGSKSFPPRNATAYAASWATSGAADRCLLHAQAIQKALSQMRLSSEPALHIPHCTFLAGIAAVTYAFSGHQSRPRSPSEFPEFNLAGTFTSDHLASNATILFQNRAGEQMPPYH